MALWTRGLDAKTPRLEEQLIREQHVCPYCNTGRCRRIAIRRMEYPYRWIPSGYACDTCYGFWTEQDKGIKIP